MVHSQAYESIWSLVGWIIITTSHHDVNGMVGIGHKNRWMMSWGSHWDRTGSRCISRISPSRCLQVTRRCRPLFDMPPDDSICAAALKRSQVPPIFGFPPGVQTGCPECLRFGSRSILELNPTVLVGFVIFWKKYGLHWEWVKILAPKWMVSSCSYLKWPRQEAHRPVPARSQMPEVVGRGWPLLLQWLLPTKLGG